MTLIEILSPTNKIRGARGRTSFMEKRRDTLASDVHWVEIDLLRTGPHVLAVPEEVAHQYGPYDYLVCVNLALGAREGFHGITSRAW